MNTGNIQLDVVDLLTVSYQVKTAFGKFVESNILSGVITCRFQTISDDVAWQTFSNLSDVVDFTVDNEDTLLIQFFCKLPEGMTDVIDIFKEIQMVFFYIKDDLKTWIELQEAVGIFAGFCNEIVGMTHADIAVEAAKAGKHIFCEKPVDLTVAKIKAVEAAVKEAGVKLQIGFNRRYDHNFAAIKDLANAGKIGQLQTIKITSRDPEPPPVSYVKVSGGIFLDMTVHDFDMARFIGGEVEEVFVNAAVLVDPAIGEAGDVDTALVSLKFKNGAIGVIDNCRKASYGYDQRLEVFGSKAQASAANDTPTHVAFIDENGKVTDKPLYFFLERYMQSFTDEMTEFIDCVLHDKPTKTTVEDGLQALRMGLAAKKSLAEHRPVKLSEIEA